MPPYARCGLRGWSRGPAGRSTPLPRRAKASAVLHARLSHQQDKLWPASHGIAVPRVVADIAVQVIRAVGPGSRGIPWRNMAGTDQRLQVNRKPSHRPGRSASRGRHSRSSPRTRPGQHSARRYHRSARLCPEPPREPAARFPDTENIFCVRGSRVSHPEVPRPDHPSGGHCGSIASRRVPGQAHAERVVASRLHHWTIRLFGSARAPRSGPACSRCRRQSPDDPCRSKLHAPGQGTVYHQICAGGKAGAGRRQERDPGGDCFGCAHATGRI